MLMQSSKLSIKQSRSPTCSYIICSINSDIYIKLSSTVVRAHRWSSREERAGACLSGALRAQVCVCVCVCVRCEWTDLVSGARVVFSRCRIGLYRRVRTGAGRTGSLVRRALWRGWSGAYRSPHGRCLTRAPAVSVGWASWRSPRPSHGRRRYARPVDVGTIVQIRCRFTVQTTGARERARALLSCRHAPEHERYR